jgi:hypothetical protein
MIEKCNNTNVIIYLGAFFVYAFLTAIAFVLFFIYVPETKNTRIDDVEFLFMKKLDRQHKIEKNLENDSVDQSRKETAKDDSNVKEEEQKEQSQRKEPFSVSAV